MLCDIKMPGHDGLWLPTLDVRQMAVGGKGSTTALTQRTIVS
jgi:hypothetical protein